MEIPSTILVLIAIAIWLSGYFFYSPKVTGIFRMQKDRPTPAVLYRDDIDFYPAKPTMLFGDHWAAISGGAPLANGVVGLQWGFLPLASWLWLGSVLAGGVHDHATLYMSVRRKGDSIGRIASDILGPVGGKIFTFYTWFTVMLMNSIFIGFLVTIFTTAPQAMMPAIVGFMSAGPIIGFFVYKRGIRVMTMSIIMYIWVLITIWIGYLLPIPTPAWVQWALWTIYPMISASIPAWWMIEPRNYMNFLLMATGCALLYIALLFGWMPMKFSMFTTFWDFKIAPSGPLLPLLIVIVSCGAISGLHAVWTTGYTARRIGNELDTRLIGYGGFLQRLVARSGLIIKRRGGFLLESLTATSTMFSCMIMTWEEWFPLFKRHWTIAASTGFGKIINGFYGIPYDIAVIFCYFWLSCFIITTLDGGARTGRILMVDLWGMISPKLVKRATLVRWLGAITTQTVAFLFTLTGTWLVLYPIFGSTMLMVGALSLGVLTCWLKLTARPLRYHMPLWIFIYTFCVAAFIYNIWYYTFYIFSPVLSPTSFVLLILVAYLGIITVRRFRSITPTEIKEWAAQEEWPPPAKPTK
jgi:carbon starvation protein